MSDNNEKLVRSIRGKAAILATEISVDFPDLMEVHVALSRATGAKSMRELAEFEEKALRRAECLLEAWLAYARAERRHLLPHQRVGSIQRGPHVDDDIPF